MLNWVDVYDLFKIINLTSTYCYFFWATIHRSKCATIYPFPTLFYMSLVIFILSCYVFFRIHKGFDLTCMHAHINQNCLPRMCSFHFLIWTSYIVHIQKLINWIFKKIHCLRWRPSIHHTFNQFDKKCVCKVLDVYCLDRIMYAKFLHTSSVQSNASIFSYLQQASLSLSGWEQRTDLTLK